MAANLDKAESSLSSVSDVAYLRAIDASGNSVKISKADLASVLGVGLFIKRGNIPSQDYDFRNNAKIGIYHIPGALGTSWKGLARYSDICVLFNNKTSGETSNYDTIIAIAYDITTNKMKYYNSGNDAFENIV